MYVANVARRHGHSARWIAYRFDPTVHQATQQSTGVIGCAANQKIVGSRSPGVAHPFFVALKATTGGHQCVGQNVVGFTAVIKTGRLKLALLDLQAFNICFVVHPDAQFLCGAVLCVQQRLAAAQEKSIGSTQAEGAAEGILKTL